MSMSIIGPRAPSVRPSDADKAYAAGFFDGEGNICLHRHNSAGKARLYRTYASSGATSRAFARLVALGYAVPVRSGHLKASEDLFNG